MFSLQPWQWAIIGVSAIVFIGYMTLSMLRMFPSDPTRSGVIRPSTPLETGFVGALPTPDQNAFDGWSYRVQGRYAGRVRVVVDQDTLTVAGPRIRSDSTSSGSGSRD